MAKTLKTREQLSRRALKSLKGNKLVGYKTTFQFGYVTLCALQTSERQTDRRSDRNILKIVVRE